MSFTQQDSESKPEPVYITALLRDLSALRDNLGLPQPVGVRATKSNGIATVEVATFAAVMAWADALGTPDFARHSSSFKNGSSAHSAWAEWLGWHVRVAAYVDAPEAPVLVSEHAEAVAP